MKISINWLKEYLETKSNPEEISDILTNLGLEVEKILPFESVKGGLSGVVAGKVLKCEKHPNADRLKVTSIDLGNNETSEIVCGAPNIMEGQIVPIAKVGSKIYKTFLPNKNAPIIPLCCIKGGKAIKPSPILFKILPMF